MTLYLTFDYELFLGENHASYQEVLFDMTDKIADVLESEGVRATFFVDVFSAIMHKKYGLNDYIDCFERQIQDLIRRGFDVQLHIHPHWVMSTYDGREWIHRKEYYRITAFEHLQVNSLGECWDMDKLILYGKSYLESVCRKADSKYQCIAFRAGGYAIQPLEKTIPILRRNGIYLDSSVATGAVDWNVWHSYNFMNMPINRNYYISDSGLIREKEEACSGIYEIPIGAEKNRYINIFRKSSLRKLPPNCPLGTSIDLKDPQDMPRKQQMMKRLLIYEQTYRHYSLDEVPYTFLIESIKKDVTQDLHLAIVGHPKLFDDCRLQNMKQLVTSAKNIPEIMFTTMQKYWRNRNEDNN